MTAHLVAIHLHGPLADRYGTPHNFAVSSPREAVAALDANFPGFLADFARHERYGIIADGDVRDGESAAILPVSRELHFVPLIEGNVPIAALLVGLAFPAIAGTLTATIIGGLLMTGLLIGISLLFKPKKPDAQEQARDESFIFTGPENVTGQGVAVPLIYGRVFAGSVVVSAGTDVAQLVHTTAKKGKKKPVAATTTTPAVSPPQNKQSHDALRMISAAPGLLVEEPFEPWPDLVNVGAGTDHIREDVPPEGWPAIIADPVYGFRPEYWIASGLTWVVDEEDDTRKQVMVWQPDYETEDYVYNWNMVRGFYVTDVGIEQEDEEWIEGSEMEVPVEDPEL